MLLSTSATIATASISPFPLSAVKLTGDWADKQRRNQDVLLSLNLSQYACHFTTTANLTTCLAPKATWHSYQKTATGFVHKAGFLAAGDDVKPPAQVTFAACEAFCASNASCAGITFEDPEPEPTHPIKCYWKSTFRLTPQGGMGNCVALGGEGKPSCSPLPGEMGLGGYYGHYQGHWLSATAFLFNNTGNETVRATAATVIETFASVMAAWKAKYGYDGYLFPYDPLVFTKLLAAQGAGPYYSVPFYTLHKLMAGLLDQYEFAQSARALELVCKMATWVGSVVDKTLATGGQALWQRVLGTEWGGMNDVLYHLYAHTRDPEHLRVGRLFNAWVFSEPLARGVDDLATQPFPHANFHLPEIVGFARAYELSNNSTDLKVASNFFDALFTNHTYATGGSNSGECWQAPRDLGNFLSGQTEESCTQYNVLKVARRLFLSQGDARHADFYELALNNGILGNQNRDAEGATSYIYMQPLGGVATKPWGKSDYGFPCCWGTLSESFAKLSDSIFFRKTAAGVSTLYVNQYVDATLTWDEVGATVEQRAPPEGEGSGASTATLTVHLPKRAARTATAKFTMMLRIPGWLRLPARVTVNGQDVLKSKLQPGTYVPIARAWADGDVVSVNFPPSLWTAPLNDYHAWHNATLAFMYGPLVLAAVDPPSDTWVPAGHTFKSDPSSFIRQNASDPLEFIASGADGSSLRMIPLKHVMEEQYVVYFYTAGTKPPQPSVHYCPHSAAGGSDAAASSQDERDDDHGCEPAWPPSAPTVHEAVSSRGVRWGVDGQGRLAPHQPVYVAGRSSSARVVEKEEAAARLSGDVAPPPKDSVLDVNFLALQPH